jgi:hypothetical protein
VEEGDEQSEFVRRARGIVAELGFECIGRATLKKQIPFSSEEGITSATVFYAAFCMQEDSPLLR